MISEAVMFPVKMGLFILAAVGLKRLMFGKDEEEDSQTKGI